MTFAYLTDKSLKEVQRAAIDLGFTSDANLAALTADILPAFVAASMVGGTGPAKLLTLTSRMNTTRALVTGEVQLLKWLENAIMLAAGAPEELVFRRALEIASVDGAASATTSPADDVLPITPIDIRALPRKDGALEIAILEDDTLDVGFLHTGADVSRSVAKLQVPRYFDGIPSTLPGNKPDIGLGTGWIIAPGLLITNFHVVNARLPGEPAASDVDFARQGDAAVALFDFYHHHSAVHHVGSTGCVASDHRHDYAVLRLAGDSSPRPALRLHTSPILRPQDRVLRERVNVLQHPGGNPMRLGFHNNFVVTGTPLATSPTPRVAPPARPSATMPGSSRHCTGASAPSRAIPCRSGAGQSARRTTEHPSAGILEHLARVSTAVATFERARAWSVRPASIKRGYLLLAGVVALVAGVLLGRVPAATPPVEAAAPNDAVTSIPTTPAPILDADFFTSMKPCRPGTFVVFLQTLKEADDLHVLEYLWKAAWSFLKLRALRSNGDLTEYWTYHLNQERQRIHQTRYHNGRIPQAA